MITINDATFDDLTYIGSWVCDEDRHELALTRDPDDYLSLAKDAEKSAVCKVALDDAIPVMAFGAKIAEDKTAIVWGFKTNRSKAASISVTKYIKRVMIPVLQGMGIRKAVCLVHPANRSSQDWLQHLGFTARATRRDIGTRGEEIILFQRDEPDEHQT